MLVCRLKERFIDKVGVSMCKRYLVAVSCFMIALSCSQEEIVDADPSSIKVSTQSKNEILDADAKPIRVSTKNKNTDIQIATSDDDMNVAESSSKDVPSDESIEDESTTMDLQLYTQEQCEASGSPFFWHVDKDNRGSCIKVESEFECLSLSDQYLWEVTIRGDDGSCLKVEEITEISKCLDNDLIWFPDSNSCKKLNECPDGYNAEGPLCLYSWKGTRESPAQSCKEILDEGYFTDNGVYWIDPASDLEPAFEVYCDLVTAGGGWTLAIKYNSSAATMDNHSLPYESGRSGINRNLLTSINTDGDLRLAASLDIRPFIVNGASELMHIGKSDNTNIYTETFFSEIYQSVLDNPDNLFNPALDSTNGATVIGQVVGFDANLKNRFFDKDMVLLPDNDLQGEVSDYRINGGEGNGMWTNGGREGAVYCSHSSKDLKGHFSPYIQWTFTSLDGNQPKYLYNVPHRVGTHAQGTYPPKEQINLMFVR